MSSADDPSDEAVAGMEEEASADVAEVCTENPQASAEVTSKQSKNSRKRTKTGCLTCRKRRIKCGEERPRCNNCVKSKRNCEGYNQRVIFKDPIHGYRSHVNPPHAAATTSTLADQSVAGNVSVGQGTRLSSSISPQFPVIAPRPFNQYSGQGHDMNQPGPQGQPPQGHGYPLYDEPFSGVPQVLFEQGDASRNPACAYVPLPQDAGGPYMADPSLNQYSYQHGDFSSGGHRYQQQSAGLSPGLQTYYSRDSGSLRDRSLGPEWSPSSGQQPTGDIVEQFHASQQHTAATGGMDLTGQYTPDDGEQSDGLYDVHDLGDEEMEDGLFDTRQEYDSVTGNYISSRLGSLLPLQPRFDDSSMRTFRTLLNEPNMLATYQPSPSASPLTDPRTARIFAHFISATGPSLSIFERHPTNPSALFTDGIVPKARQSLWTYTIPMLALTHPPLMQAILAISSLHIAKLQGGSTISSLKHYHIAIMRIKKAVGLPSRRAGIGTLAATLLLGYYEVIGAEHGKWNSHLLGAKQLLREIDFAGITRQLKAAKAQEEIYRARMYDAGQVALGQSYGGHVQLGTQNAEVEGEVDENLVSHLMGRNLPYDHHGQVIDETMGNNSADTRSRIFTAKELRDFQVQSDLFWWFCKQDVFQSILSGNRLLMEYDRWGECLPRAPIGRLDSVYGTADHLFLLSGRLADFNARDVRRKKRVMDANGGQWKPPKWMGAGPPGGMGPSGAANGSHNVGAGRQTADPGPSARGERHLQNGMPTSPHLGAGRTGPPMKGEQDNGTIGGTGPASSVQGHSGSLPSKPPNMMLGMIPPTPAAKMPEGFTNGQGSPGSSDDDEQELEAATIEAEQEWEYIKQALQVFEESLGPDYKCLSSEYQQSLATPFGPAIYYRTYSIACIWAFYYTALIIHKRAHPSMPPAAMMAAGVAARETSTYANEIGRICAGLIPSNVNGQVSPALGGALCESVIPLFFAGVQYQDPGQRGYLVTKLREITRMTGWQTASAVAAGCETTWATQGQLGRGPPYTRTRDPWAKDERVSGNIPGPLDPVSDTNSDRRFVQVNAGARVHWAIGIIGVEEDLKNLSVD